MDDKKSNQVASTRLYLAATSALLGAIGMGMVLGWTSPALVSMERNTSKPQVTDKQDHAWIASSMTLGALGGALISAYVAQTFGRKVALIVYGVPFTIGWLCLGFASSVTLIIIGRVITGFSAGLLSGTAPTYIKEIATVANQGPLGTGFQICVTIGILLVYMFGIFLDWKVLSFLCAIPTVLMSILMVFMPETPGWLLSKNRKQEAEESMKKLRGNSDTNQEITDIENELKSQQQFSVGVLLQSYTKYAHFMPAILAFMLMFFQQFSGINAVMFFSSSIFKESKVPIDAVWCSMIIAVVQVICTVFCGVLISRFGRKTLLYISGGLHCVSLGALGVYYYATQSVEQTSAGFVPVICLVVFIIGFSVGYGPIPWLMIPEFTPLLSRSATCAAATALNWGSAFLISRFFESLNNAIYKHGTFFLFSFICLCSMGFTFFALPETKDKKDSEIAAYFKSGRNDPLKNGNNSGQELRQLNP